jgi:maltose O-acetyltransferase
MLKQIKKALRRPTRDLIINTLAGSVIVNRCLRKLIYKLYGMKLKEVWIAPGCNFATSNIEMGSGTWINANCTFNNAEPVKIGNHCHIAFNVMFITTTHEIGTRECRAGKVVSKPITVGNGCWIGAGAVILPGVTIGDGCIIGAGSVVTKNCEPNAAYAGNPAKIIKRLVSF